MSPTWLFAESTAATQYCPACELELCGQCAASLHSNKGLAKHSLVELQQKARVMPPPECERHKGSRKNIFCTQCNVGLVVDTQHL